MSQPENQQPDPGKPHNDLASELRELGQQLEAAVRNALQADKAKQVQQDLSTGMKEIGVQLKSALKSIQENPTLQQLVERGEQAVNQAQQSKAAQDFQESLARGVAQLNEQLAAFVARMRQEGTSNAGAPAADQPPPDAPATGETTRLDPDEK